MQLILNLSAIFFGSIFWALSSTFLIERYTEPYLFDSIERVPQKEHALVLGANKNGKLGINYYFKYRMEAAANLYFNKKVKNS